MAARKKVRRKVNARLGQIRMDGSVNASLDSKARYAVLVYRQSRRTSVWHFVARAAERLRREAHRDVSQPLSSSLSRDVRRKCFNIFIFKGTTEVKFLAKQSRRIRGGRHRTKYLSPFNDNNTIAIPAETTDANPDYAQITRAMKYSQKYAEIPQL